MLKHLLKKYPIRLILICGLVLFFLVDLFFSVQIHNYEISAYPHNQKSYGEQHAVFNGPFSLYIVSGWEWLGAGHHIEIISAAVAAVATVFIAAYTITLARATGALTILAEQQEKTARTHERAYVHVKISDDPKFSRKPIFDSGVLISYVVAIGVKNNGRTPASVKEVKWTLCMEKDLIPGQPVYQNRRAVYIELTPQLDWATKAQFSYRCDTEEPQALFAEITYEDVFRDSHRHRMLLRITRAGDEFKHDPIEGGQFREYWEWN